ncbi:MAG: zinc ribbon domain-containing protein [Candidatus Eremiobacteraeota bacterium]|nr:zinc ribbon domain-containing protein [Candidatus Eremiobacteraeota bacterium]
MKVCTRCGAQNQENKKYCVNCQAVLPNIPAATQSPKLSETVMERYYQLKEAGDLVLNGEWTVEEYGEFLESISQVLAKKEQEIREIEIPEEAYDDFAEELEVGFNGIALYNEGIAHMMLYLEDEDPEHIEYGLQLVDEGNESINKAMKVNRENRRKLEEMYIDTSTMM